MNKWERGQESTETEKIFGRKDWDLVHQALSVNKFGTMFDVCERVLPVLDPRC